MVDISNIQVVKNTGQREIYDREKLRTALQKAGANEGEKQKDYTEKAKEKSTGQRSQAGKAIDVLILIEDGIE